VRQADFNARLSGWTAGAGFEYAFLNNWRFKAEYLYVNLGDNIFDENVLFPSILPGNAVATASLTAAYSTTAFHVVRVGLNYKFDYYYASIVTR